MEGTMRTLQKKHQKQKLKEAEMSSIKVTIQRETHLALGRLATTGETIEEIALRLIAG